MYNQINHVIDRLTGFKINDRLNFLLEFDGYSREQIHSYQNEQFERLKKFARQTEHFKGIDGQTFNELPIVHKQFFRSNPEHFYSNIRKPYRIEHTSGSTSIPVNIRVSKEMLLVKRSAHQHLLYMHRVKRSTRELKIGGHFPFSLKKEIYYLLRNKKTMHSLEVCPKKIKKQIEAYNKYKPGVLYGFPSALGNLAAYANNLNVPLHQPKIVITHAETLYDHIFEDLKKAFPDTPVVDQYWSTEANMGKVCPYGNMHVDEDTVIFELDNIDKEGYGDVVITNLFSYDMPLIRLKIGDRAKMSDEKCPCGRQTKIIKNILGRTGDFVHFPDGRKVSFLGIYTILRAYMTEICSHEILYSKSENKFYFNYVSSGKQNPIKTKNVKQKFHDHLNSDIVFQQVDRIETEPSGKQKFIKTIN